MQFLLHYIIGMISFSLFLIYKINYHYYKENISEIKMLKYDLDLDSWSGFSKILSTFSP